MGPLEMRREMRACTQDCAPECAAACPVHVDARGYWRAVRTGDFDTPLGAYRHTVLFPRLVSAFCAAPCEKRCSKNRAGDGIAMRALEESLCRIGTAPEIGIVPFLELQKKVAVVGGGISGLAAGLFLYEKGFRVTVFEASARLGGRGWALDAYRAAQDFAFLEGVSWQVECGVQVGRDILLDTLLREYDAVYLSGDAALLRTCQWDSETLQCVSEAKLFAGGSALRTEDSYSIIDSIASGRKAALSADRFLKNVSLTAGRENEGSYETGLLTLVDEHVPVNARVPATLQWGAGAGEGNLQPPPEGEETGGIVLREQSASSAAPHLPSPPDAAFTRREAMEEAGRCIDCGCLRCVRQCVYMQHYQNHPFAIIREMATHIRMIGGQRQGGPLINSCSLCGLCKEICPNRIEMVKAVLGARRYLVQRGQNVAALHEFPVKDMDYSNGAEFSLYAHAAGESGSRHLFFPGCQLAAVLPRLVRPSYEYLLSKLGPQVGIGLGCCGAPAHWAGYEARFSAGMADFLREWERLGRPCIVAACPTCRSRMQEFCPELPVVSLWEVFARHGLPKAPGRPSPALAVQDACGCRERPEEHRAVRELLSEMGCPVNELAQNRAKTKCCNYGGLMTYGNPALARAALSERLGESENDFLVYCGACREQCQRGGKKTWHLLELLFGGAEPPVTDITEKRRNRRAVKREMTELVSPGQLLPDEREPNLKMTDEVRRELDARRILIEEAEQVILEAERTKRSLKNPKTGHSIAHLRMGYTTYWVEYRAEGEGYRVFNAYTHRLQFVDD